MKNDLEGQIENGNDPLQLNSTEAGDTSELLPDDSPGPPDLCDHTHLIMGRGFWGEVYPFVF